MCVCVCVCAFYSFRSRGFHGLVRCWGLLELVFTCIRAMLAWMLAMALCPSTRPSVSVKSRCFYETGGHIELVFVVKASFSLSYTVL